MPYLSRKDLESIAQRVVTAYRKLPAYRKHPPNTVCPEALVGNLLGLSTEYHVLSRNGTVLGLTCCGLVGVPIYDDPEHPEYFYLDGKTLLIDKRLIGKCADIGRYHFTLAHEACHQIYWMLFPREYAVSVSQRKIHYYSSFPATGNDYWEEWRTNALTSAVLMPTDMVLYNMTAFGLGAKLRMLNRVFAPEEYERFEKMAAYMGVSKRALAIRLKYLGLLDQDYLQDPYALVDIHPDEETCHV